MSSLSHEEKAIICQHRAQKNRRDQILAARLKVLQVAAEYEAWLQANERDDSFSTFINEFGYQGPQGSVMHDLVNNLRNAVIGLI